MKLKNKDKLDAASKVLDYAIQLGFHDARLAFEDQDENFHESVGSITEDYEEGDDIVVCIHLTLDEDLQLTVTDEGEYTYNE